MEFNATAASVLGFLSIGPLTGWDLNDLAQVSVSHFWNMTRSQIYRELRALTDLGLVQADDAGARNTQRYRLTERGRHHLHAWLTEEPGDALVRDPFLVKLFFADQLNPAERQRLLTRAEERHRVKLATLEAAVKMADQLSPYAAATARYGVAVEQAILRWFSQTTAELAPTRQTPRKRTAKR